MLQTKGKYKYLVLVLLYLGWCVSYIDRAAITFAATQIASEFQLKPPTWASCCRVSSSAIP
jgi:hypothetical protein